MTSHGQSRRPVLAYRVGITGKRTLQAPDMVAEAVRDVLGRVRSTCEAIARDPSAQKVYAVDEGGRNLRLTMISPLAEGADRLVAREALAQDYRLIVPMPFEQAVYETTFEHSDQAFHDLLSKADSVLALDGARGRDEWRAFDAVGRLVARNCDLLIAIWDPTQQSAGRGGTEDIVEFAVRIGVPVWLIDPSGATPSRLVTLPAEVRHPPSQDSQHHLAGLIWRTVGVATVAHKPPHDGLMKVFHWVRGGLARLGLMSHAVRDPLLDFLDAPREAPRVFWSGYDSFLKALTWKPSRPRPERYTEFTSEDWRPIYSASDDLAQDYARRYRASYLYVLGLAALSPVLAAAESLFESWHHAGAIWVLVVKLAELFALVGMLSLVIHNLHGRWHEKWISYRLLAELCRKQQALGILGWSLPIATVNRAVNFADGQTNWIDWYFQAWLRGVPLPAGSLDGHGLDAARDAIKATLLNGQIAYHRRRADVTTTAAGRLSFGGTLCFLVVLSLSIAKIFSPLMHSDLAWAEVILSMIAAISAGLFAIRAYAEFEVLADQSERMIGLLESLQKRLDLPAQDGPLASQELGADLFHLTQAMLQDISGWAQLFRMKAVETS